MSNYRKRNGAKLSVIIPAAGSSRRMRTHDSKSLIELSNGENVISRQIKLVQKQFPKAEIITVVGYQSEKMVKHLNKYKNIKIVENELYDQTSIVRSIDLGLKVASHPNILVIYGDLVFNSSTLSNINKWETTIIIDDNNLFNKDEVGVTVIDEKCTYFSYGLDTKWAQIVLLTGKELTKFKELANDKTKRKLQTFEILNIILEWGGTIKTTSSSIMNMVEIDIYADIERARKII